MKKNLNKMSMKMKKSIACDNPVFKRQWSQRGS